MKHSINPRTVLLATAILLVIGWIVTAVNTLTNLGELQAIEFDLRGMVKPFLTRFVADVGLITLLLWLGQETYRDLGFRKADLAQQVAVGFAFGLLIFITSHLVVGPIVRSVVPSSATHGIDKSHLFFDPSLIPLWITFAVLGGGFLEELHRIFAMTRLEKLLGKSGLIGSVVVTTLIFGIEHLYQGTAGAIAIGFDGLLYALVFLRQRSAVEAIAAHASFDLIGIGLGYLLGSR